MLQSALLQDLIANLDTHLPWLLPSMEAVEQAFPSPLRLAICVPLLIWLAVMKQRSAMSAEVLERVPARRSSS